jgi:hypothetical protein
MGFGPVSGTQAHCTDSTRPSGLLSMTVRCRTTPWGGISGSNDDSYTLATDLGNLALHVTEDGSVWDMSQRWYWQWRWFILYWFCAQTMVVQSRTLVMVQWSVSVVCYPNRVIYWVVDAVECVGGVLSQSEWSTGLLSFDVCRCPNLIRWCFLKIFRYFLFGFPNNDLLGA